MSVVRVFACFLRAFLLPRAGIAAENLALRQQLAALQLSVLAPDGLSGIEALDSAYLATTLRQLPLVILVGWVDHEQQVPPRGVRGTQPCSSNTGANRLGHYSKENALQVG